MRKALLVVVALALIAPARAAAKELTKIEVCGPAACAATQDRALIDQIAGGDSVDAATPALQPYYKIVFTVDVGDGFETWSNYYVPALGVEGFKDEHNYATWVEIPAASRAGLDTLVTGIAPFPKPTITGVTVAGRKVSDPASYERLITLRGHHGRRVVNDWRGVRFATDVPSPWSSDAILLRFSPKRGYIYRDHRAHVLPRYMAARVKAGKSLGAVSQGVALCALAGAVFGVALLVRRRNSR
jgi:hypothetical protein